MLCSKAVYGHYAGVQQDLSPEEKKVLNKLIKLTPDIKMAYDLQNMLTDIFEKHICVESAKIRITYWAELVTQSGLSYGGSFLKMLTS